MAVLETITSALHLRKNDMKAVRDIAADRLDELFREATLEAARSARAAGVPVSSLDDTGRLRTDVTLPETPVDHHR